MGNSSHMGSWVIYSSSCEQVFFLWSSLRIKNSKVTKFLKMATGFWKCFHLGDFVGSRIEVHHHLEMIHLWNALNIKHNFDINKALESHQQRMIWMSWEKKLPFVCMQWSELVVTKKVNNNINSINNINNINNINSNKHQIHLLSVCDELVVEEKVGEKNGEANTKHVQNLRDSKLLVVPFMVFFVFLRMVLGHWFPRILVPPRTLVPGTLVPLGH